jgi:threonine/homoserine/homoserine lactone efflux protein
MIAFETAMTFLGFAFALALVPGPDNIFVLTQSALHGRMSGIFVTLGLVTGLIFHTSAVAFGVAAIFQTSAFAFSALKYIGAAYLLYLAYLSFRAGKSSITTDNAPRETAFALYKRGLIMNIANPKVTIFFLAFLPQFVDPAMGGMIAQFYQLGGLMMVVTFFVFSGVALAAGLIGGWLRGSPSAMIWMNRCAGMIFVGLAAKLALAQK